jgi:hypothetical protein
MINEIDYYNKSIFAEQFIDSEKNKRVIFDFEQTWQCLVK